MNSTEVLSIVLAIGFGIFSIVGVMITLFLWNRGEANSDRRSHGDDLKNIQRRLHRLEKRK